MVSLISISTSESKAIVFLRDLTTTAYTHFLIPHKKYLIISSFLILPHSSYPILFLIPVPNSIFLIPHTPFLIYIPHSSYPILFLIPVPNSIFLIPHSIFPIPHTPFLILYSPFLIPHILFFILLCLHSVPEDVDQVPLPVRNKSDQTTNKRGTSKETSEKGLSEERTPLCKGHLILPHTNTSVYQNYLRIRDTSEYRTLSMSPSCPIFTGSTVY